MMSCTRASGGDALFSGVSTDSRSLRAGDLFVRRRERGVDGGELPGMDALFAIEPERDGVSCRVTISHDFSPRVPGFARFVDRFFTRPIAGRTLATFKALAEAVAEVEALDRTSPIASEPSPATKSTS